MPLNWPLNWIFGSRDRSGGTIEAIYGVIVAQARQPAFYLNLGVPDTVEGRFDLLILHLWLVLRRLKALEMVPASQQLFDYFCSDIDANLREMGVGDLTVPKTMKTVGEAFYGRVNAYDAAWEDASGAALRVALARNVMNKPTEPAAAAALAAYVRRAGAILDKADRTALEAARFQFPDATPSQDTP
jgi:cytochrome b pre-mRNA-processing protein 3